MEIKEILEKALEFYDDHDWIQGQSFSRAYSGDITRGDIITGACLEGSCLYVQGVRNEDSIVAECMGLDVLAVLRDAAYDLFPERFPVNLPAAVHKFNDHEDTTFEDVMLILKHARERADG